MKNFSRYTGAFVLLMVLQLLIFNCLQCRSLVCTGGAPGSPKIDQHHPALQFGRGIGLTLKGGEHKFRHGISHFDGCS